MAASITADKTAPAPREHSRVDERLHAQSAEPGVNGTGRTTPDAEGAPDTRPPMPQALPPRDIVFGAAPTKIAGLMPEPTLPASPGEPTQDQPADLTKEAPRQTAPGATEPSGAHGLQHVVQLSSERDEAAAHARSQALQTKYRDALAGRKPFIRRADLGDRGVYYRVQIGPFAIGEANRICEHLKNAGTDCVVHRN